jgi:CheY-like chemotaxis protein
MQLEPENVYKSKNCIEKSATILIVEDDELNSFYLEEVLKVNCGKILKASNGKEAVDLCYRNPEIDLVLMDIRMPVMNGLEATQQIKLFRNTLPIIAVTACVLLGTKQKIIDSGCDDCITKPINKEKLREVVKQYL